MGGSAGSPVGVVVSGSYRPISERAGYRPVMSATRVGVHTGAAAYACVSTTPAPASWSSTGVR